MDFLPNEILEMVFMNLDGHDLCRISMVCKRWRNILLNEHIWKTVCLKNDVNEEPDLSLYGDYINECGVWKTSYRLYAERCNNWKNDNYIKHQKGGESWFFQGWSSFQDICLLPTYTENTVDVFKITRAALLLDHQIQLPVPGLEPTFLLTDIRSIAAAKSNITLIYCKTEGGYKLKKLFACRSGTVVKFTGNPDSEENVSSFISANYVRCGMVRVIEFKANAIWLCDYNSGKLFVIKDEKCDIKKWFTIDSVTFFKTGSGYVCFWTNKCLSLCSIDGEIVFVLADVGIDFMSFNENYIGIKFSDRNIVETWNVKKKESLTTIEVTPDTSLTVHKDSIFLLQLQSYSLSCHNIRNGNVRWKISYKIPGPPRAPLFACQLSIILNKFLLVFPSHRYGNQAAKFTAFDITTGNIFYSSKYTGMVVEVSDRLLVTLSSRREGIESGNHIFIRCYI